MYACAELIEFDGLFEQLGGFFREPGLLGGSSVLKVERKIEQFLVTAFRLRGGFRKGRHRRLVLLGGAERHREIHGDLRHVGKFRARLFHDLDGFRGLLPFQQQDAETEVI